MSNIKNIYWKFNSRMHFQVDKFAWCAPSLRRPAQMYSYKISRFAFPVETRSPVVRDDSETNALGLSERIAHKTDLEFYVAPFFAGAAIFGGKDSMKYGRHYELVKFNVFIIARFPRRPRTKRATVNRRFLALLSVVSPFGAIATKGKMPFACFLSLIISMLFFKSAFVIAW